MNFTKRFGFIALFGLSACRSELTAGRVCERLLRAGAAADCKPSKPGGIGATAREVVAFKVPGLESGGGQVFKFAKAEDLDAAAQQFAAVGDFLGPHRYASRRSLIFVLLNPQTPAAVGGKAKALVSEL